MRIIVGLVVFVVCFGVLCGTVIVTARQQPLPQWLTTLHFEQCQPPCWIGIQPGVTTLDEALTRLNTVYPSPEYVIKDRSIPLNSQQMLDIFVQDEYAVTVTFYVTAQQTVKAIDFYLAEPTDFLGKPGTYADIHSFLGRPSYLRISSWGGDTLISYPVKDGIITVVSWMPLDQSIRANNRRDLHLRLISRLTFSKDELPIFVGTANLQWRGFLPLSRYRHMVCLKSGCEQIISP